MSKNLNTFKTLETNERTPEGFYKQLDDEFHFDFDPCPLNPNPEINGLLSSWGKRAFINPPYGKAITNWLSKALLEIRGGETEIAVFLLPAYTDVKWFHEIVLPKASEIRFLKGRLKFGSHNNSAPFANMIVIFEKPSTEEIKP
jgi:site-specific DNA-methyltransferase (adenine-specific)